jgi:hypothetical protein
MATEEQVNIKAEQDVDERFWRTFSNAESKQGHLCTTIYSKSLEKSSKSLIDVDGNFWERIVDVLAWLEIFAVFYLFPSFHPSAHWPPSDLYPSPTS